MRWEILRPETINVFNPFKMSTVFFSSVFSSIMCVSLEEDGAPPSRGGRRGGEAGDGVPGGSSDVARAVLVNVRAGAAFAVTESHLDEDRLHLAAFPHHELQKISHLFKEFLV